MTQNGERFFLKYIYYLNGKMVKSVPVNCEPRGWKTLNGALRFAKKLGYEVENADEYN